MGQAKRKREARRLKTEMAEPLTVDLAAGEREIAFGHKVWPMAVLRQFVPHEDPIASRYHPSSDSVFIACASGGIVRVARSALTEAERQITTLSLDPSIANAKQAAAPRNLANTPCAVRTTLSELTEKWQKHQATKSSQMSSQTSFLDEWELAEARCEEAKLAKVWGDNCIGTCFPVQPSVVLLRIQRAIDGVVGRAPYCAECAVDLLRQDISLLDCNPDE